MISSNAGMPITGDLHLSTFPRAATLAMTVERRPLSATNQDGVDSRDWIEVAR